MKRFFRNLSFGMALLVVPTALLADDLTGAKSVLCTVIQATACFADGTCEVGAAWEWNIPQFIEVDLVGMKLSTTKASGENRSTAIKNLERDGELIVVQGFELGRAFSFVINEKSGMATVAVAREDRGVTIMGSCTPMPAAK
jgi:hypothetical protein